MAAFVSVEETARRWGVSPCAQRAVKASGKLVGTRKMGQLVVDYLKK